MARRRAGVPGGDGGLTVRQELDGESLRPLLVDAKAKRKPALITFLPGNFAVRDERWRYIRCRNGTEELYDERTDPDDFHNLAADPKLASVKRRLARYIPDRSAPMAPGRDDFDFDFATHTYRRK